MNAAEQVHSVSFVHAVASAVTLVRQYFPHASVNLNPWRDDPQTRRWCETETLDIAFYFPGWSPRLECRSLLLELRLSGEAGDGPPHLLGILIRGMTFDGERWRLATIGDWEASGSHLPQPEQLVHLKEICRGLFALFSQNPC